jgi:hypothetical protein
VCSLSFPLPTRTWTDPPLSQAEWKHFANLNHLIPPSTPARDLNLITYPHRDDPSTKPIKEGLLERKKRFTKSWKEGAFSSFPLFQ